MVDYNALKTKFPVKNPAKRRRVAAIKEIAREYERKRAELGSGAPLMKKGIVFYAVVIIGLLMLGGMVLSVCGKGGRATVERKPLQAQKSMRRRLRASRCSSARGARRRATGSIRLPASRSQ